MGYAECLRIQETDTGFQVYELDGKEMMPTRHEYPTREEAETYIKSQRFMDQSCDQLQEQYLALVGQWLTDKAKETGIERKDIGDWITGLQIDRTAKEYPADSANDQRGEEEDSMQEPPVVKIPDYSTEVEPPKPVFPLPADHQCDRQGVPTNVTGEWDYVEDHDLPQRIIQNAMERVASPLSLTKMYLSGKVLRIAEAHLPPDVAKTLYWHWRIDDDLEVVMNQLNATVAGLVSANLPARFTSLDGTLRTAMVDSGLCCEEAANQLIASFLLRNEIALMEEHIPGFNPEWLTIQGAQTHKDILLEPAGPQVQSHPTPQRPAPKPTKLISPDSAQVTLRGKPVTKPTITLVDNSTLYDFATGIDHAPFFEANFKMEVADVTFEVSKNHHKSDILHEECGAIQMAGDVQVSGTMVNTADGLLVLVDQWFPITEEADAPAA